MNLEVGIQNAVVSELRIDVSFERGPRSSLI